MLHPFIGIRIENLQILIFYDPKMPENSIQGVSLASEKQFALKEVKFYLCYIRLGVVRKMVFARTDAEALSSWCMESSHNRTYI